METCTTLGCFSKRQTGDSIFCNKCRQHWREFVRINKLENNFLQGLDNDIAEGLEYFKQTHIIGSQDTAQKAG